MPHAQIVILAKYWSWRGPGSSIGIATDYGLNVTGSNPSGDEIFRPSRPALGPCKMGTGSFSGVEAVGACC